MPEDFTHLSPLKKLARLIRLGTEKRPQAAGSLFGLHASCALGAGLEGIFLQSGTPYTYSHLLSYRVSDACEDLSRICGIDLVNQFAQVPGLPEEQWHRLRDTIEILNDGGHWSREQIADWLESEPVLVTRDQLQVNPDCWLVLRISEKQEAPNAG